MPIVTLAVKMAFNPSYNFAMLGFDVAFIGVAFDTWAVMTLAAQRRVMYGGFFDLPEDPNHRVDHTLVEGLLVAVITGAHYACAALFARMVVQPHLDWRWTGLGVVFALALPYGMIDGMFLPGRLKNAA